MQAKFYIGQFVKRTAFTDCFGKFHEEVPNLIVTQVTLQSYAPYYRIVAEEVGDRGYYEGAERFFAPMMGEGN